MNKSVFPLFLAAMLATPAYAFDSSDPFGVGVAQAEKPAKAPREKNDGRFLETMVKSFGAGLGVGAVGVTALGAVALPSLVVMGGVVIGQLVTENRFAKVNSFYSGAVIRGKVNKVIVDPDNNDFGWPAGAIINGGVKAIPEKFFGFDLKTFPSDLKNRFDVLHLDVNGPGGTSVFALTQKGSGIKQDDIVDVKSPVGVFALNTKVFDNLHFDFNKHMPRVVNVYCKHNNPTCQNDYDSSLGVLYRHQDTEFPPSQYLIDPAIITADQAKMRKEAEDKKAASNSGGFSFM